MVTIRPGRIRALSAITIGESVDTTHLRPGDIVYELHYIGEGNDLLWFKGRKFSDQVHAEKPGQIPGIDALELLEPATTEWWVKVRNSSGKEGWSVHPEDFKGSDACGD